jgi:hypothetical protein
VWGKAERRHLTGAQEMGYVFHLHERHGRLLELDAGRHGMVNEPGEVVLVDEQQAVLS